MDEIMRFIGRWVVACCLLLAGVATANPAGPEVYEGTLGKSSIVVLLTRGTEGIGGQYFYRRHRLDIPLEAQASADAGVVMAERGNWRMDATQRPQWTLRPTAGGGYAGQWRGSDGRTLPITLKPVDPTRLTPSPDPALERLRLDGTYDFLRLSGLQLQTAGSELHDGYRLQWWREPISGLRMFEIVDGYAAAERDRINRVLRERLWKEVLDRYECLSGDGEGEFDQTVAVHRIAPKILSASVFTSYYCGGAHPDFADDPINLDPRDAASLSLDDVLAVDAAAVESRGADYAAQVRAPWLVAQLQRLYPEQMAPAGEDECDYNQPEVWSYPGWYATAEGLHIGASFYRAARACDDPEWSVLPWSLVREHHGRVDIAP